MSFALIRTTSGTPDTVDTFDTRELATAAFREWTSDIFDNLAEYYRDGATASQTDTSLTVTLDGTTFQRWDILEIGAGI